MRTRKSFLAALGLVTLGGVGTYTVSHLSLGWRGSAEAAPAADPKLPPPTPTQIADARSLGRTFAQVANQVGPSVVRISVSKTVKMNGGPFGHGRMKMFRFGPGGQDPFEFNDDGQGQGDDEGMKQQGTGSGVVIDDKGDILTNNHVVDSADEVKVTFVDGKTVKGKVVGTDPKTDLAVVRVEGVKVQPAKLGDSDKVAVGEFVIAIGNPFGLDHTVTVGVLSAKNRSGFTAGHYEDFLQTDASINPGNSGGPLVNLDGEIIGINTMIAGMGTGIGFAVPSSMARPIVDELVAHGKVKRPYLGIRMQDVTEDLHKAMGAKAPEKGALVGKIDNGTPAEKAGVKPGDVITAVDGAMVDSSKAMQQAVLRHKIGQKLTLTVWRDGKTLDLQATTAELPGDDAVASTDEEGNTSAHKKLGVELQSLTPELAERLHLSRGTRGAVITNVKANSPAANAGLQPGDVVMEVDRQPVTSGEDAVKALGQAHDGAHLLRVARGDGIMYVPVPIE